jgi:hypothetical protein
LKTCAHTYLSANLGGTSGEKGKFGLAASGIAADQNEK